MSVYAKLGGRKSAHGLLAAVLLTAMAFPLDASFEAYAGSILLALGLTTAGIAYEDTQKHRTAVA